MADIAATDELFFTRTGLDRNRVTRIVEDALKGADDGELYLEYSQSESLVYDDGRLKNASFDTSQGFGLRAVSGETAGFSHASELSEEAIRRSAQEFLDPDVEAADRAAAVATGEKPKGPAAPAPSEVTLEVLNGNGVAGAADEAGYLLAQRGYQANAQVVDRAPDPAVDL